MKSFVFHNIDMDKSKLHFKLSEYKIKNLCVFVLYFYQLVLLISFLCHICMSFPCKFHIRKPFDRLAFATSCTATPCFRHIIRNVICCSFSHILVIAYQRIYINYLYGYSQKKSYIFCLYT